MIVNHSKTELILFTKKCELPTTKIELEVGNTKITSINSIKALGITIDKNLDWNSHINALQRRFSTMMSGLRIIARKLDQSQMLKVVTSQVFSILYYSSQVWLTTELSSKNLRKLESMHYAALRLSMKDYKKSINRDRINQLTKRMPPKAWMNYSAASLAIKIIRVETPTLLYDKIMQNAYQENRKPTFVYTFDASHNKHGKKGFHNWINLILK